MSNTKILNAYQEIADSYAEQVPDKDFNAHYDRPAILSLLDKNIKGQNILDAGCGTGIYSEILSDRSAIVTGIDQSENMLFHARSRNMNNKSKFIKANFEEPLSFFKESEFDGILSTLAISYVKDLSVLFKDFNRILKKNAWLVFSTEHPFFTFQYHKLVNYFDIQSVSCKWKGFNNKPIEMFSYHHSLGYICESLSSNGFIIEKIVEAKPTKDFQNQKDYDKLNNFPAFINFRIKKK